jgi:DNA-binding transcriptional ArsR family regulator
MTTDDLQPALAALGHRTRLAIVHAIAESADGGATPSAIADAIGIPRNLMSSHLLVLERVGLVTAQEQGRNRFLRLDADRMAEVGAAVTALGK